ncbi:MAG: protein translocase subunit SecD [Oligoflexia bacterium]|nr:protein translocase subunit SecD [Oligoflexia bacterium]
MQQRPIVAFQLNPRGALTFAELTKNNVGRLMAIVLDDVVQSAPAINEPIPGGAGTITLGAGGDQAFKEARDLAIILRAGALPAQLDLLEQRVIGPSLGADSIKHGLTAGLVGCLLVFVFTMIYYRMSGVVATVSLILNLIFTLAILVGVDATLTLPGIAGLALTIGMAVDSNVIIFERIRDELREGKMVFAAVQAGFDKAFACIFDANITHGIVAIILLNFGTGPIKGFAVTLLIGIVTTIFCAVTVCKLFFDYYLASKNNKVEKLSI